MPILSLILSLNLILRYDEDWGIQEINTQEIIIRAEWEFQVFMDLKIASNIFITCAWAYSKTTFIGYLLNSKTRLFLDNHICYIISVTRISIALALCPPGLYLRNFRKVDTRYQGRSTHEVLRKAAHIWPLGMWKACDLQFYSHVHNLGR